MTDYERLVRAESEVEVLNVEVAKLKCEIDTLREILLRLKDKLYAHCDEYSQRDIEMMFGSAYERDIDRLRISRDERYVKLSGQREIEEMFYNDESEGRAGLTD